MCYIAMSILTEMYVFSRVYISAMCLLKWLRPFISTNGTTQEPMNRFESNLILENFTKNCRATLVLTSIWLCRQSLYLKINVHAGTCIVCSVHIFRKAYGPRDNYNKHKWANVPELLCCACIQQSTTGFEHRQILLKSRLFTVNIISALKCCRKV
jgi:hypothetical protein